MDKNLGNYNEMLDRTFLMLFKRKYKHFLLPQDFEKFPLKRFDIAKIYQSLVARHDSDSDVSCQVFEKLLDIKTLYFFLDTSYSKFYLGATLIVANGELEKVDENTISLLQHNHYKVYLISSLYEKLLDLFELIYFGKMTDPAKNKWGRLFEKLSNKPEFDFIDTDENHTMCIFRDKVRRGEIHGFSSVFRQLFKDHWDHFQVEEKIIKKIIERLYSKFA